MQAKLNYYSRYNRIKLEQKKSIPSLYSLLSTQTLNKLAHDASVSLQMISFYNRQNNFLMAQEQLNESQYLKASKSKFNHSIYFSLDEKAHSVSPSAKNSRDQKMSSSLIKKQKTSKKKYLENLVKEVREKSLQMVKKSEDELKQERKKKKSQKTKKSKAILKEIIAYQLKEPERVNVLEQEAKVEDGKVMIQNKLIKQLLAQGDKDKMNKMEQKHGSTKKEKIQNHNFKGQYVESVQDENQQNSKHSIVIERLNLTKHKIGEQGKGKQEKIMSKEDNPSEKDNKESEIKSFSKESVKKVKPSKNLIEIELTHSQSQIWKPQQRSLQNIEVEENVQESPCILNQNGLNQDKMADKSVFQQKVEKQDIPIIHKTLSIFSKEESLQEQMNDMMCEPIEQITESYPMSKSYKFINSQTPIQFLSQLYQHKQVQEAPFQHPLQVYDSPKKTNQPSSNLTPRPQLRTDNLKKTSFKKFIMNKELNPRLVTSTILNEKNTISHHPLIRDFAKDPSSEKEKQNEQPTKTIQAPQRTSQKKNFKKVMMMSKKTGIKQGMHSQKEEKVIPLRRLQNQKLLHAFFNQN